MHFFKTILIFFFITTSYTSHAAPSIGLGEKTGKYCLKLFPKPLDSSASGTLQLTTYSVGEDYFPVFGTFLPDNLGLPNLLGLPYTKKPLSGSAIVAEDKDTVTVNLLMENGSLALKLSLKAGLKGTFNKITHTTFDSDIHFSETPINNIVAPTPSDFQQTSLFSTGTVKPCEQN